MKHLPLLLIALLAIAGCGKKKAVKSPQAYTISGIVADYNDTALIFARHWSTDSIALDTVMVDSSGYFEYSNMTDSPNIINILYPHRYIPLCMQNKQQVIINIARRGDSLKVEGDKTNAFIYSPKADSIVEGGAACIRQYILNNTDKASSLVLLRNNLRAFHKKAEIDSLLDSIAAPLKSFVYSNAIRRYTELMNNPIKNAKIHYITLYDNEDKRFNLFETSGSAGVVSVWATYDSASVRYMRELKKLAKELNGKNVKFINVSLDANDSIWKAFVKKEKFPGHNARLRKGFRDDFIEKMGVDSLPMNIISDSIVFIRDVNVFGAELKSSISRNTPKKKNKK